MAGAGAQSWLRAEIQRSRRGAGILVGSDRHFALDADLDARAQGLSLSRRPREQPHRPHQARSPSIEAGPGYRRLLGRKKQGCRIADVGMFDHLLRDIRSVIDRDGEQNAIPPLDGALSPNDRLDACTPIGDPLPGLDDVVADNDGALYVSAGKRVLKLSGTGFATRAAGRGVRWRCRRPCAASRRAPPGLRRRARACRDRSRQSLNRAGSNGAEGRALAGLLSVAAAPDGRDFRGGRKHGRRPNQWRSDLMEKRRNGRLIACDAGLDSAPRGCQGLCISLRRRGRAGHQQPLVHRELGPSRQPHAARRPTGAAKPEVVLRNLPGYPARLHPDGRGGFYLGTVRAAHAFDRIRAEGRRFSRGDDGDDRARTTGSRPPSPAAAIVSSRCRSASVKALGHPKALGAAALLRPAGASRRQRRSDRQHP